MSNIDKMTANEQLFTELTSEEGAVVEGGATLLIHSVFANRAAADGFLGGGDDVYIKVNGKRLDFKKTLKTGDTGTVNLAVDFTRSTSVQLMDEDGIFNPDDRIGRFTLTDFGRNEVLRRLTAGGSGSSYTMTYSLLSRFQ